MKILVAQTDVDTPLGLLEEPLISAGAVLAHWFPREELPPAGPFDGLVVLGSESNPDDDPWEDWIPVLRGEVSAALELGLPTLGVCFGAQILAEVGGGTTSRMDQPEIEWIRIRPIESTPSDPLLAGLNTGDTHVLAWHRYSIGLPPGAIRLVAPTECEQAFRLGGAQAWGIQFHLEATPEIADTWIQGSTQQLAAEEIDSAAIGAGSERFAEPAAELARSVATRFAAVAGERAAA